MDKPRKRHISYSVGLILIILCGVLAWTAGWFGYQMNKINNENEKKIKAIQIALDELVSYAQADKIDTAGKPYIYIELNNITPNNEITNLTDALQVVQNQFTQASQDMSSYITIFSIIIAIVVLIIPLFNYLFTQKDQITFLKDQYAIFEKRYEEKLNRLDNAINQSSSVVAEAVAKDSMSESETIISISDSNEDKARANYLKALMFSRQKQYHQAIKLINNALALDSKAHYFNVRGFLNHEIKRYDEALKDKIKAIELEPDNARYYISRGATLNMLKRHEEALVDTTKAIELEPDNALYYDSRCITLNELKRHEEALKDITKAIELEPDNARFYDSRAVTLLELKRYEEAVKDETKAIEMEPDNARFYYARGVALHQLKRYEDALSDKTRAIEMEPDNARFYNSRGKTFNILKQYEEALDDTTKAIEIDSDNAQYYDSRGVTQHNMKHYADALKDKTKAIEVNPENARYYASRGTTLNALKRYNEALGDATKALELEPTNIEYSGKIAFILYKLKDYNKSLKLFNELVQKSENPYYLCYRALAELKLAKQNDEEVKDDEIIQDLNKAISLDNEKWRYYLAKAEALIILKQYDKVKDILENANKLNNNNPEVYHMYGAYYTEIGDKENADKYFALAKENGYIEEP